jgi:GT2 family glycosyltransferase
MLAPAAPGPHIADCSLVVVAFHKPASLATLLGWLGGSGIELVVVNVEEDEGVAAVAAGAVLVPLPGNPGYAAGVNRGAALAHGDVVVFSNDDVLCDAAALRELAGVVARGEADVAVPRVVDETGATVRTVQALPSVRALTRECLLLPDAPVPWLASRLRVEKWREPAEREVVGAASAVMVAVRADLLREVPLPEAYFMYWEEAEWFARLARRGARVLYVPDVTIEHAGGRVVTSVAKSRLLARNAVRCIRRLEGPGAARTAYIVGVLWQLRLVVAALVRRVGSGSGPDAGGVLKARLAGLRAGLLAWQETRR